MSDIDSLLELSKVAHRSGELGAAAKGYAAILAATPDSAPAWHLSGLLAHQMGRTDQGINHIKRSIDLHPSAERLADLAEIYLSVEAYAAAEQQATAAMAMDPESPAANYCRGVALARQGKTDEALHHFHKAIDARYKLESALLEAGLAFQSLGDVINAIDVFSVLLEQNPHEPAGYFHLSKFLLTGHYAFSSQQVTRIQSMLDATQNTPASAARLHFSLGYHYEATQEFAKSFEHYRQANRLQRQMLQATTDTRSFAGLTSVVDRMIRYFDEHRLTALENLGHPSSRPIFVVGLPRSGTTLCAHILARHPDIVSAGELPTLGNALQPLRPHWDTSEPTEVPGTEVPGTQLREAASEYLAHLKSIDTRARFVVDKMPDNAIYVGFIHVLFPHATIIHCRRDPRDVVVSNFGVAFQSARLKWETSDLETIAETIKQKTRLARHWKGLLPGRVTELFYETLVESPKLEARRLLRKVGVEWSDACEHPEQQCSVVESASSIQVRKPIYRSSIGRWKRFAAQLEPVFDMLRTEICEYEHDLAQTTAR